MPRSIGIRFGRAGFALLAVWCLGCTSFDVVIDALLDGRSATMTCMDGDGSSEGTRGASVTAIDVASSHGCGCDHCAAVQTDALFAAALPNGMPSAVQREPDSAHSIDREPLVPPPIGQAAI